MSSKTAAYIATEEEFDALITGESWWWWTLPPPGVGLAKWWALEWMN